MRVILASCAMGEKFWVKTISAMIISREIVMRIRVTLVARVGEDVSMTIALSLKEASS